MYNLNCQSRTWKTIKLFKPLSFSYNNSKRWFTTTFKVTNTYFDHYVNRSDDTAYSYDDKFHRPDGCISLHEFKIRRNKLTSAIIKFHEKSTNISQKRNAAHHHLLIIPASQKSFMVGKVPYFYRQATDFRYLTGHLLPEAALVLEIEHDGQNVSIVLC